MTMEKTEEKAVETTTPSAPEPAKELETLRSQLAETTKTLEATREQARKHEQAATRNANKLQEQQKINTRIERLEELQRTQFEMQAEILDSINTGQEDQPKIRRSEQYREKLKPTKTEEPPQYPPDFMDKAQEAEELARSAGLDMAKSKELRTARMAFRDFDADDGLEEVKKVVESKRQSSKTEVKTVETPKKPTLDEMLASMNEKDIKELERRAMERDGLLISDTGVPGGNSSDADFVKKFGKGDVSVTKANVDRYNKIKSSY